MISFDQFKQIELRVVKIIAADRVAGSDKLLCLRVSLGEGEEERQIIAGIGKQYVPTILVGRQIIMVANLEPRILMGLESQGMLLAVDSADGPVLLQPDQDVAPGSTIK